MPRIRKDGLPWGHFNDDDSSGLLFNVLRKRLSLPNDVALAKYLGVEHSTVSKIRHGRKPVGKSLILDVHEKTGMPVAEIRRLIEAGAVS